MSLSGEDQSQSRFARVVETEARRQIREAFDLAMPTALAARPALPSEPVRVSLRYVANQPAGAPCWRAIVEPPGALPETGLVVHRVTFAAPCWTEQGARGHVVGIGRVEWEAGEGLNLRVR